MKILPRALKGGRRHKYIQCFGRNFDGTKKSFLTSIFLVKLTAVAVTDLLIHLDGQQLNPVIGLLKRCDFR